MKNKLTKIIALFFASSLLTLTIISSIGAGALVVSEAYTTKKDVYVETVQEEVIKYQLNRNSNYLYDLESIDDFASQFDKMNVNYKIEIQNDKNKILYSNIDKKVSELPSYKQMRYLRDDNGEVSEEIVFTTYYEIDEKLPIHDGLRFTTKLTRFAYDMKDFAVMIAFAFGVGTILSFSLYVYVSKSNLTWVDKIPSDLYLTLVIILMTLLSLMLVSVIENLTYNSYEFYIFIDYILAMSLIGIVSLKSLIVRIINKELFSNSIIGMIFRSVFGSIADFSQSMKDAYRDQDSKKIIGIVIIFTLAQFPLILFTGFLYPFILIAELIYIFIKLMKFLDELEQVKKLSHDIAHGNLEQKGSQLYTDPKLKNIAGNLLTIQEGVRHAVDNELKNERLKTELITNVSHDLKTPLTAIISYLDLLENASEQEEKEYLNILTKQSQRMKKLIDDLLEMSKVSSKTIPVTKDTLDLGLLLNQVVGEYQDKYDEKNLDLILTLSEDLPTITTDPDLMWRVFANVFSNAYRYSNEGTRVYVDLRQTDQGIDFSIKNTSYEQLNISSDELMERFVRGDRSRNTEGSGLGLSIVGNILDILEHDYQISIDGDLFKFEIKFDIDA